MMWVQKQKKKIYAILQRKGQLAGCSLGYTPYLSVSKLSFVHWLHEAETGSRPTNGSYARSSNSNALNTMPNVIVNDLITWDL